MKSRALMMAIISAAMFGVSVPFSKTLLSDFPAAQLAGLLYIGAAIFLLPFIIRRRYSGSTVFPCDARNRFNLLSAVFFGGVIGPVLLLIGLRYSLSASVSIWLNLESVATALIAFTLFREHIGRWTWAGNAGVVVAGILLGFNGEWGGWCGFLCISGAAVAWGLDNNFTSIIDSISPEDSTFWKGLIAGSVNLIIGLSFFTWHISAEWLWALLLGGFAYGLSIALYIRAAQGLGAVRAQMIFASAPFWGVLFALTWLNEGMSMIQIAAVIILVIALALMFADKHEHIHLHEPMLHEHVHVHNDKHHTHEHSVMPEGRHSHPHVHEAVRHSHPHWPDLHHRHHNV